MKLHVLHSCSVKSFSRFLKCDLSWLVHKYLPFVLKEMGDSKGLSSTSATEIEDKISGFTLDIHGCKLTSLVLYFEFAIEERLRFEEIDIFGGNDFVAIRGVVSFVKSDLELFFHLSEGLMELKGLNDFYFLGGDFKRVYSEC